MVAWSRKLILACAACAFVGPAFVESGSGQTVVFAYASGRAVASARTAASAEASVSVRLSGVARVRTGCGCRR